jgi:hypothetical protein
LPCTTQSLCDCRRVANPPARSIVVAMDHGTVILLVALAIGLIGAIIAYFWRFY